MQLPNNIYDKITELSEEGDNFCEIDDFDNAINKWSEALKLLPSPKMDWEAYTWLSASIGDAQYQNGNIEAALESFFDALNGPTGTENPFILYRLGQCHIKLNKEDKGVEFLLKAYMLDGDSIFHEDPEGTLYLKTLKHKNLIT